MSRSFNGTSDKITTSLGALGFAGASSMAAILKFNGEDTKQQVIMWLGTDASPTRLALLRASSSASPAQGVQAVYGATSALGATKVLQANGWVLIGASKTTGTTTPRLHIYNYGTNLWVHENNSSTVADHTAATTAAYFGERATSGSTFLNGELAIAGAWNTALSDQNFEDMAYNYANWAANSPKGLWKFDQATDASTVSDLSGGGANSSAIAGAGIITRSVPPWGTKLNNYQFMSALDGMSVGEKIH